MKSLVGVPCQDVNDEQLEDLEAEALTTRRQATLSDEYFNWDVLDGTESIQSMMQMIPGDTFDKVKAALIKEFEEAERAGEKVEIYIRRLAMDLGCRMGMDSVEEWSEQQKQGLIAEGGYYRIRNGVTMDSGCSVFVMPSGWLSMFELKESEGSKRGPTFHSAAKLSAPIHNEGQRTVQFMTKNGDKRKMTCQVAAVNKILASVDQICDGGNEVYFRRDGGEVHHLKTGKRTPFRIVGNVYVMDAWIEKPQKPEAKKDDPMNVDAMAQTGFARPVAR